MKKITAFIFGIIASLSLFAQTPSVTTTIEGLTPTTITASFAKNDECTKYHILASVVGEMDQWSAMFGTPLRDLVISWSLGFEADTTYTWTKMVPNTEYVVYVVAVSASDTSDVMMTNCTTPLGGGEGESVMTVEVSNITETSVVLTATPNDQTTQFLDGIVERAFYEEVGQDSLMSILTEQPMWLYETDVWEWLELDSGMEYYAFAIGQNALGVWGEMTLVPFKTLDDVSLNDITEESNLVLYPNPAKEQVLLQGLTAGSLIEISDIQGKVVMQQEAAGMESKLDLSALTTGVYHIKIYDSQTKKSIVRRLIVNE